MSQSSINGGSTKNMKRNSAIEESSKSDKSIPANTANKTTNKPISAVASSPTQADTKRTWASISAAHIKNGSQQPIQQNPPQGKTGSTNFTQENLSKSNTIKLNETVEKTKSSNVVKGKMEETQDFKPNASPMNWANVVTGEKKMMEAKQQQQQAPEKQIQFGSVKKSLSQDADTPKNIHLPSTMPVKENNNFSQNNFSVPPMFPIQHIAMVIPHPQQPQPPPFYPYMPNAQLYPPAVFPPQNFASNPSSFNPLATTSATSSSNFAPKVMKRASSAIKIFNPETKQEVVPESVVQKRKSVSNGGTDALADNQEMGLDDADINDAAISCEKEEESQITNGNMVVDDKPEKVIDQIDTKDNTAPTSEIEEEDKKIETSISKLSLQDDEKPKEKINEPEKIVLSVQKLKKAGEQSDSESLEDGAILSEARILSKNETRLDLCNQNITKRIYTVSFLLKFKDLPDCKVKPADLPNMEAIIGIDAVRRQSFVSSQKHSHGSEKRSDNFSFRAPPGLSASSSYSQRHRSSGGRLSTSKRHRGSSSYHEPPEPIGLPKSENRWVPPSLSSNSLNSSEVVLKQLKGLLNKLTLEKFDSISKKISKMQISDFDVLSSVIELIYEKAIDDIKFAEIYAKLIFFLAQNFEDFPAVYQKTILEDNPKADSSSIVVKNIFRKSILNKCQTAFEDKAEWSSVAQPPLSLDTMSQKEIDEYNAKEAERKAIKRKALGNIRLIGELFKFNMLSEKIMHSCIQHLMRDVHNPEEEEIESLCDLMCTVGKKLDTPRAQKYFQAYMNRFNSLWQNEAALSSRVRFKVKDTIDLYHNKWILRERQLNQKAGPMTLDQVKEFKKLEKQQFSSSRMSAPMKIDKPNRDRQAQSSGGWSQQGSKKSGGDQKTESQDTGSIGSKDLSSSKGEKSKNLFDMLEHDQITSPVNDADQQNDMGDEMDEDTFDDLEISLEEDFNFEQYCKSDFAKEFTERIQVDTSEGFRVFLKLMKLAEGHFAEADDFENQCSKVIQDGISSLIDNLSQYALRISNSENGRNKTMLMNFGNCVAKLTDILNFKFLRTSSLIKIEDLKSIIGEKIGLLQDTVIDVPGCDKCLGYVVGSLVFNSIVDINFVKENVKNSVEFTGDYTPRERNGNFIPSSFTVFFANMMVCINENEDISNQESRFRFSLGDIKDPWWGIPPALEKIPDEVVEKWLKEVGLSKILISSQ